MPEGVDVVVEDGLATIDFVDKAKRGPGLNALLEHTPPDEIHGRTRPRVTYTVPVEYARAAGLLDGDGPAVDEPPAEPKGYDDGFPDMDWKRDDIDDYAAKLDPPLDTTGEKNKQDAIAAIKVAKAAQA